ncbi:MAG TPA: CAP domain-containing protein [Actinomycetota bacterium]|nr:CAP domain-containing protein [Actinomycetota bacterium]
MKSTRTRIIAGSITVALLVAGFFVVSTTTTAAIALDAEEAAFCRLINDYRAQNGLGPLMVSEKLTAAADWYATDMATQNYFNPDHTDSEGRTVKQRIVDFGYTYSTSYAENIAGGRAQATGVFEQWKNSSVHNANMLNGNFKVIGIGRATDTSSSYDHYWVTDFGGYVDPNAEPCPGTSTTTPSPSPSQSAAPSPSPSATASPAPSPSGPAISVADTSTLEGNSATGETKLIRFVVSLPRRTQQPVTVTYSTSDGTAQAGSDYLATTGQVTIAADARTASVNIPVIKDRAKEGNETFNLTLSNPVNGTIGDGTALGTITNDD